MGSPLRIRVLNDVAQTIHELSVRTEAWAFGCVRDRSGYETLNQLRIKNYELRILRLSESRAELVRAMPSGSKMFYEVKELRKGRN